MIFKRTPRVVPYTPFQILDIRERAAVGNHYSSASNGGPSHTGRSQPPFGIQLSNRNCNTNLETYGDASADLGITQEAGLELSRVDSKRGDDRSEDSYLGAVKVPISGIRVDVEKGVSTR